MIYNKIVLASIINAVLPLSVTNKCGLTCDFPTLQPHWYGR